jgi:hypothetical protein
MPSFRYATSRAWLKGNAHIHSTASDGGHTREELAAMYAAAGYDFLFLTDHGVPSATSADGPLLLLGGLELDGTDATGAPYHVVCLGDLCDRPLGPSFESALEAARARGALLILAHPHWTGNSLDDSLRHRFHGVEIYNHVCRWLNGKGDGLVHWSAMLARDPGTLGLAADDAHITPHHPGWNGGWIMVNAAARTPEAIMAELRAGNFYSSCGPEFRSITGDGGRVAVQTSPVQFARLVGPGSLGQRVGSFGDERLTQAAFEIPADWPYAYLEIEDAQGRRAWTNTLLRV